MSSEETAIALPGVLLAATAHPAAPPQSSERVTITGSGPHSPPDSVSVRFVDEPLRVAGRIVGDPLARVLSLDGESETPACVPGRRDGDATPNAALPGDDAIEYCDDLTVDVSPPM